MVIVHWRVLKSGKTGHGSPIERAMAVAWLTFLRKLHSSNDIGYWLEDVK